MDEIILILKKVVESSKLIELSRRKKKTVSGGKEMSKVVYGQNVPPRINHDGKISLDLSEQLAVSRGRLHKAHLRTISRALRRWMDDWVQNLYKPPNFMDIPHPQHSFFFQHNDTH